MIDFNYETFKIFYSKVCMLQFSYTFACYHIIVSHRQCDA